MSLAYITGGQYVPMVNSKLLAKVIIGGVREEISLDRLMQAAEADIAREMRQADEEGADEKEKAKRINSIFASKNLRSHQMKNTFGTASSAAKHYSSACTDMSAMQSAYLSSVPAPSAVRHGPNRSLMHLLWLRQRRFHLLLFHSLRLQQLRLQHLVQRPKWTMHW